MCAVRTGCGSTHYRITLLEYLYCTDQNPLQSPQTLRLSTHTTTFACAWKVKPSLELVLSHIVVMRTRRRLLVLIP